MFVNAGSRSGRNLQQVGVGIGSGGVGVGVGSGGVAVGVNPLGAAGGGFDVGAAIVNGLMNNVAGTSNRYYTPNLVEVDVNRDTGMYFGLGPQSGRASVGIAPGGQVNVGLGSMFNIGYDRNYGMNLQLGTHTSGNVMDLSLARDIGFSLSLLNGLANINISPGGTVSVVPVSGRMNYTIQDTGSADTDAIMNAQTADIATAPLPTDGPGSRMYPPPANPAPAPAPTAKTPCAGGTVIKASKLADGTTRYLCKYPNKAQPVAQTQQRVQYIPVPAPPPAQQQVQYVPFPVAAQAQQRVAYVPAPVPAPVAVVGGPQQYVPQYYLPAPVGANPFGVPPYRGK